ncbi:MAG: hypothetical protein ABW040_09040 [Microbacteriaceae bacterium]
MSRRRTSLAAVVTAALAGVLLTGCGSTAAYDAEVDWVAEQSAVESTRDGGSFNLFNTRKFGEIGVVLRADASEAEIASLVRELAERHEERTSFWYQVILDDDAITVHDEPAAVLASYDLWASARVDPRLDTVAVEGVRVTVTAPASPRVPIVRDLLELGFGEASVQRSPETVGMSIDATRVGCPELAEHLDFAELLESRDGSGIFSTCAGYTERVPAETLVAVARDLSATARDAGVTGLRMELTARTEGRPSRAIELVSSSASGDPMLDDDLIDLVADLDSPAAADVGYRLAPAELILYSDERTEAELRSLVEGREGLDRITTVTFRGSDSEQSEAP